MESIYLFIVVILFVLAISDLVVGVSNDAVNFLNSAIGAKVASFRLIMAIAAVGVFVGATFSSGMMEVARKGIFNPQFFYFGEIMVLFLAVMLTDIILLDGFNTLGLPTSTTVSIVFEIMGAAVAISLLKIMAGPAEGMPNTIMEYINSASAIKIIFGILLSVVVAFSFGALVQYIARLIFTFNYKTKIKRYGSIFGGLAIAAITYFILLKGAKNAPIMTSETKAWIKDNTFQLFLYSFIGWTVILQILSWIAKINILKLVVLVGTFALAMAFAGNDLVNFIGVPLAGFESFKTYVAEGHNVNILMESLAGKVKTPPYMLFIAGGVMVATLYTSKKAKRVVKTSLDLSRQDEGDERFGSSALARSIVRMANRSSDAVNGAMSEKSRKWFEDRFDQTTYNEQVAQMEDPPSFDMIRASVNLVVASILIAIATSLKLPLSTTYVTFMVAMGTSLADKAWGRESAVYRVTGVFSVIGGWFLTALIAFTVSFIIALFISWASTVGIIIMVLVAGTLLYRSQFTYKKREAKRVAKEEAAAKAKMQEKNAVIDEFNQDVVDSLEMVESGIHASVISFTKEDRRGIKKQMVEIKKRHKVVTLEFTTRAHKVHLLEEEPGDISINYISVLNTLGELLRSSHAIIKPLYDHVDNGHSVLGDERNQEFSKAAQQISLVVMHCIRFIKESSSDDKLELIKDELAKLKAEFKALNKAQLKRIKVEKTSTRQNLLYLTVLQESRRMLDLTNHLIELQSQFIKSVKE